MAHTARLPVPANRSQFETSARDVCLRDLVGRCVNDGSDELWAELVRRAQPVIAATILKTLRHRGAPMPNLIDDLVQEAFLKLCAGNFKALRQFTWQHENGIYSFLKVIAANVVTDYFRCARSQKRGSGAAMESLEPRTADIPSQSWDASLIRGIVVNEISDRIAAHQADPHFSRDYTIFRLYFHDGLTAQAIAALPYIELSVKGVESALLRLTRMIRAELKIETFSRRKSAFPVAKGKASLLNGVPPSQFKVVSRKLAN